tara:strand:+ start:795 stop:1541 length:747 start_codon:yes stop_codon:yes gene_type:complete
MMRRIGITLVSFVTSLFITSSPVCSIYVRQDDRPTQSERSSEKDPPRSLDELLGIDEGPEEGESPLENRDRKRLDDRLQEREIGSDLESAIEDMDIAADMISVDGNFGLDLQRLQKSIIDRLDAVIEEAKRRQQQQQSSGSSSSSDSTSEQSTNDPPSNTSGQQQEGDEGSSGTGAETDGSASGQPQAVNIVQSGSEGVLFEESDVEWGRLPDRVREVIRQGMRESISRRYKALTEAYYRRLAEEASQ